MSRASDRAYAIIRDMILAGELLSGAKIGEEALAEQCGVSRTPIREALSRLEAELLIRRSDTQRSFVADWSLDDVEEMFELRGLLESRAARRAAKRINWSQIERLKMHHEAIGHAIYAATPDTHRFIEHNHLFHGVILEASASAQLTTMLARIVERPIVHRTAQNYSFDDLKRSHRQHGELLAAFEHRDPVWAEAVMVSHIRRAFHAYASAHTGQRITDVSQAAE
ncbi:GntR family transcriptional regulator [Novosphingobium sp. Chol11]|uniref:GntR family transcriptional regulator n=1 Tax=Novosphingobium sp. Chol11 TaxID=1385763 RepID=UPI0025E4D583|nr:GntR family transcriptional regulator [Novosphingobium sp. Chol11]